MIVLDTHAFLWWVGESRQLTGAARKAIDKESKTGVIGVSAISIWEICLLVATERLILTVDIETWFHAALSLPKVEVIPIDAIIAKSSVYLAHWLHKDPADRFIVATAIGAGAPLVTGDEKIRSYKYVRTIW